MNLLVACTADTMVFLGCFGLRDSKIGLWLGWVWSVFLGVRILNSIQMYFLPYIAEGFSWWFVSLCTCLQKYDKK
jgi:hypothetical protein